MDQVKEFLRLAVKYRFWILVGVAALMPLIAFFVAHGPITTAEATEAATIKSASSDVKNYTSGTLPNNDYMTLTDERTAKLTRDVNAAHKLLYERQAPLLTWPPEVQDQFQAWGRKYPEGVDDAQIANAVNTYAYVYNNYVDEVYNSFRPFDYETGEGVVVAPTKYELLRPSTFSVANPPTLTRVWAAQQRLWIQRTVLDVIDSVNKEAKNWVEAPIKQITGMEVATPLALDQLTSANVEGEEEPLDVMPEILKPGEEAATEEAAAPAPGGGMGVEGSAEGNMSRFMVSGGGMGGSSSGGGASQSAPTEVYIVKQKQEDAPFQVIPIYLSVLVEQDRMPELFIGFKNSPMTIQVLDMEWARPSTRVRKPEKGEARPTFGSGLSGMMGGDRAMNLADMMSGANASMNAMRGGSMGLDELQNRGMMGGAGGRAGGNAPSGRTGGTDIATDQIKKLQEKSKNKGEEENEDPAKAARSEAARLADPYYNVVEVRIYGQARFYNPPPPEEPAPSESESEAETDMAAEPGAETPEAGAETAATPEVAPADVPADAAPAAEEGAEMPAAEGGPDAPEPATGDAPAEAGADEPKPADEPAPPTGDAPKPDAGTETPKHGR